MNLLYILILNDKNNYGKHKKYLLMKHKKLIKSNKHPPVINMLMLLIN